MTTTWTSEQIMALAPDTSSVKAGKELGNARKWKTLGHDEGAAWGECQGSGATPYQTQIDLSEPAFRCSCPSRKFPCKHGLGLFLILTTSPGALTETTRPAWVETWMAGRAKRAAAAPKKDAPLDPAARAKREDARQAKVNAGLADLDRWLRDLARRGLADVQAQPNSFWEGPAARLVDAQAPGAARLLREMAGIPASGEGWAERLLERLGRLHLLLAGYRRLDSLPPAHAADVRAVLGWTQKEEELLAGPGTRDTWIILGQQIEEDEKLRTQRTWLRGQATGRAALVLDFAFGQGQLDKSLPPGMQIEADLVFYPSAYPLRALIQARHGAPSPWTGLAGYPTVDAALDAYATALAAQPWLEQFPMPLAAVVPVTALGGWALRDAGGDLLPIRHSFQHGWRLRALSGNHPLALFGEWDGDRLLPLSAWAEGRFVLLGGSAA